MIRTPRLTDLLSMASGGRDVGLPSGEAVDEFFQHLEKHVPFPDGAFVELLPGELLEEWRRIGDTQSVPWPWVMLCELALASFLSPTACFHPLASFQVYSLTWSFFLHPGSCHTSNLLRLYQNVLHGVELKANQDRAEMRARLKAEAMPNQQAQQRLKLRLKKLGNVSLRLGTGSLEGVGLKMSADPGRTAASGFLVEGTQFLGWLQSEFGVNKAIATQLWERMSWQRDVINAQRAFGMTYPFLGVCGAVHLEDLWPLYSQADPLGLRSRLCLFYTRPAMKRARAIQTANELLGNTPGSNNLESRLVTRFYHIYRAHSPEHREENDFGFHLNYPFLNYTFAEEDDGAAEKLFYAHFDQQVQLQEENYLVRHEASKRHGKLKGKHLRHAMNFHNVLLAFAEQDPRTWPTGISATCMRAADLLGRHFEGVADAVQAQAAKAKHVDKPENTGPAAEATLRTHAARIAHLRNLDLDAFLVAVPAALKPHVVPFARALLLMATPWLESTFLKSHAYIRDNLVEAAEEKLVLIWTSLILLEKLQLAYCAVSSNTSGVKKLFAVKRLHDPDAPWSDVFEHVLQCFGVDLAAYQAQSLDAVLLERPATAPRSLPSGTHEALFKPPVPGIRFWSPVPFPSARGFALFC